jgi:hypothetical protein
MLKQWSSGRPRRALRGLGLASRAIGALVILSLIAGRTAPTSSKDRQAPACKADIQRFCSEADLKQECLVARWDKISAECRNALGTSAGNHAGGGT